MISATAKKTILEFFKKGFHSLSPRRPYFYVLVIILISILVNNFMKSKRRYIHEKTITKAFRFAAVATDSPKCHEIGTNILGRGGNAVDGMIATAFCICAVHRHSCGIGGGFIATIYAKPRNEEKKRFVSIIARETAPKNANPDLFSNMLMNETRYDVRGIGVPGEVAGLYKAWELFGTISWQDLVQPTIDLVLNGVIVTRHSFKAIRETQDFLRKDENMKNIFLKDDIPLQENDFFFDEKFASTLKIIAKDPLSFYNGELANDIIQDIQDQGGILTIEDLNDYSAEITDTVNASVSNGDFTLYSSPIPSGGVILAFIMKLLDKFNFNQDSFSSPEKKVETYHRLAEVFKFASAKQYLLGDARFSAESDKLYRELLNEDEINRVMDKIKDDKAADDVQYYEPFFKESHSHGTSHANILAKDGSAACITTSINRYFGPFAYGNRTGIIFNNQLIDFAMPNQPNINGFPPNPANFIEPGKYPMSAMAPTILLKDNEVLLVIGGAGGSAIPSGIATVIHKLLWLKYSLYDAIDTKRIHHNLFPYHLMYERGFNKDILRELNETKENALQVSPIILNVISAIHNDCLPNKDTLTADKVFCVHAGSDGRKVAEPDGF